MIFSSPFYLDFIIYDEWEKTRNYASKIVDWVPFLEVRILQKKRDNHTEYKLDASVGDS